METAASVHSCVKTTLSEMTSMHIFFFLCYFGQIIISMYFCSPQEYIYVYFITYAW